MLFISPFSTQNLTHIENQRPVRPRKAKNGHSSSYSHPIVIRRDKNGRPERPLSEKPTLSEKAWRYSSQLSIRCSMPGLHHRYKYTVNSLDLV